MIYKVLKVLVKLTMFFFFRRRIMKNVDNIPEKGPTILVANHPVTFLDPLLVAVATDRPVHFLAKGAMFKNKLIRIIFKAFKMIPIYRAQDNPGDMSKNQDTFRFCYEHLEEGGLVLIFPEGISVTDRTLKPLKTGVARIALGAEEQNDFNLGVQIVPIGLTYEAPHQFRKDVLVNVGKPIQMKQFEGQYVADQRNTVRQVIAEIGTQLTTLALNLETRSETKVADFLLVENARKDMSFDQNVEEVKEVIQKMKKENFESSELLDKVHEVVKKKEAMGLAGVSIEEDYSLLKETAIFLTTLLVGIPMMLYGFVHNALIYYLSPIIARKISKEYEYQGPITMSAGMVLGLVLYPLFGWGMFELTGNFWIAMLYMVSIPLSGLITYGFYEQFDLLKSQWKLMVLFNKKRSQVAQLISDKQQVMSRLESCVQ